MAGRVGSLAALPEDATVEDEHLADNARAGGRGGAAGGSGGSGAGEDAAGDSRIELEELEIGEQIGAGAFSKVYRGRYHGMEVAIKKQVMPDKGAEKYLWAELSVLR
jgi:hypothetical protein